MIYAGSRAMVSCIPVIQAWSNLVNSGLTVVLSLILITDYEMLSYRKNQAKV